jgi:hypothetical protein
VYPLAQAVKAFSAKAARGTPGRIGPSADASGGLNHALAACREAI